MLSDARVQTMAEQLARVPGVVGVLLGGSRARGEAHPDSDYDLGLYYRPPLDVAGLRELAADLGEITEPGAWGPWVDGGGWLDLDGVAVDWLYRDLDRVRESVRTSLAGEFDFHFQVGHPLGVPDFAYAGELAIGVPLADPTDELAVLRRQVAAYPAPLTAAVVARLGEADFVLSTLTKPARRGDTTYVAGGLFRLVGLCAHALHAAAGRWAINEKGLVAAAGGLELAPARFAERTHSLLAALGTDPNQLDHAAAEAGALLEQVRSICSAAVGRST